MYRALSTWLWNRPVQSGYYYSTLTKAGMGGEGRRMARTGRKLASEQDEVLGFRAPGTPEPLAGAPGLLAFGVTRLAPPALASKQMMPIRTEVYSFNISGPGWLGGVRRYWDRVVSSALRPCPD